MNEQFRPPAILCALLALAYGLLGCTSPGRYAERFDRQASAAGFVRSVVQGTAFSHVVYQHATSPAFNNAVLVYLEGDGKPSDDGTHAALDPTPQHALALELMLRTAQPAWYLTRPCYNGMGYTGMVREPSCESTLWTQARYSTVVIDSMAAALIRHAQSQGNPRLILVGYSGGGVLAVLLASRVPNVIGVVTVAANLDTEAWTKIHGYAPLTDSLNPATATRTLSMPEIHLLGGRDKNVPVASTADYFAAHPQAIRWTYDNYDHVCCWEKNWPTLLERVLRQMAQP